MRCDECGATDVCAALWGPEDGWIDVCLRCWRELLGQEFDPLDDLGDPTPYPSSE